MRPYIEFLYPLIILGVFLLGSCKEDKRPLNIIDVKVCEHFNGADATILQVTDEFFPTTWEDHENDSRKYSTTWAEFLAFKYNIPVHVFERNVKGDELEDFLRTGRGGVSVYYPSCLKTYREKKLRSILNDLKSVYGRRPTTLSYGCGKTHYRDSLPKHIIGGRNSSSVGPSSARDAVTWYGDGNGFAGSIDFTDTKNILSRESAGRFYRDIQRDGVNVDSASTFVTAQVEKTIAQNGFYVNFMHWQDYYESKEGKLLEGVNLLPQLYEAMANGVTSAKIAKVDYNEAIEYLYAKEAVDSVALITYSNSDPELFISVKKLRLIDYSVIATPITVSIKKSSIENININQIELNDQIISVIEDETRVYLNVIFDFKEDEEYIPIEFGEQRETYSAFVKSQLKQKNGELIVASQPSKFVLFRRKKNGEDYAIEIVDREYDYSKTYKLDKLDNDYDYFCGAINEARESTLLKLANF